MRGLTDGPVLRPRLAQVDLGVEVPGLESEGPLECEILSAAQWDYGRDGAGGRLALGLIKWLALRQARPAC